ELRLLGNLEAGGKKALQVILLGQPSFLDILRRSEMASLRQRLGVRSIVEALGIEEAVDYLLHHLRSAGGEPAKIIDEAGLETLARGTKGIPRLLNQAANQALLLVEKSEMELVDAEAALEALSILGLTPEDGDAEDVATTDAATEDAATTN